MTKLNLVDDRPLRQVVVRLPATLVAELDRYRTPLVSRSELVRDAVEGLLRERELPRKEAR